MAHSPSSPDSFGARGDLHGRRRHLRDLPDRGPRRPVRRGPPAVLHQGHPGEPAAPRGRPGRHRVRHRGRGRLGRQPRAPRGGRLGRRRDRPDPRAGAHAGPDRGARCGRPGRHARRPARAGWRPGPDQPAGAGRDGGRPLGHRRGLGYGRPPTTRTSTSSTTATSSGTSSCAGPSRPSTASGSSRRAWASATRSTSSTCRGSSSPPRTAAPTATPWSGTDSHTTMVNGLGVLGWGVGGIEAEAAMLGQPLSLLLPPVVGFRLTGEQPAGTTATDLVLTITNVLRKLGRGRQVRRVLRTRRRLGAAGQPGHHRQHVARVRRHLRHVPHRRGHPRLPALLGSRRPPRRPGRGLRQGPGHVPRPPTAPSRSTPR